MVQKEGHDDDDNPISYILHDCKGNTIRRNRPSNNIKVLKMMMMSINTKILVLLIVMSHPMSLILDLYLGLTTV